MTTASATDFPPFQPEPSDTAAARWGRYLRRFENFLVASDIDDKKRKRALLLHCVGDDVYTIFENIPDNGTDDDYDKCKLRLTEYFEPVKNKEYEIYQFRQARQGMSETLDQFHIRLRTLAKYCEFHDVDREIKSQIVQTCTDSECRQKALRSPDLSLQDLLRFGRTREATSKQAQSMNESSSQPANSSSDSSHIHKVHSQSKVKAQAGRQPWTFRKKSCGLCGGEYPHQGDCPAKGKKCRNCGILNHFARVCRKPRNQPKHVFSQHRKNAHPTHQVATSTTGQADSAPEAPVGEPCRTYELFNIPEKKVSPYLLSLTVNGIDISMEIDTGASRSLISDTTFSQLENGAHKLHLTTTRDKLRTYTGEEFTPLGCVTVPVHHNDQERHLPLLVVKGSNTNLLGRDWIEHLKLDWSSVFQINSVDVQDQVESLLSKYSDVFTPGLGKLRDVKAHIHVTSDAVPIFHKPRPVPYALRDGINAELDRLQDTGIIERVTYSDWATPVVPITKTSGQVRICGDFKVTVNRVSKGNQYPIPKIADLYAQLAGGQTFTKFDMSDAYLQLELDDHSKELATINTHRGLYRYNRLPFGISAAPGIFQRTMDNLLGGIPHVVVYLDDILITGRTHEEHLHNLEAVLQRFSSAGLRLKREKCTFHAKDVVYLGHKIDQEGLHPSVDKVQAIKNAPSPTSVSELQAYLGMLNYYEKFLDNRATILEPLHELLRDKQTWKWGPEQENAFQASKDLLTSDKVLVHYDPDKDLTLACDASPYGIGAVLSHTSQEEKPIAFASRSLSAAERNYSQLEKEALAVIYGVKKFYQYLWGRKFNILTDHKPLVGLFREDKPIPVTAALRIQRWALTLAAYDYNIVYKPGSSHSNADALSRLPTDPAPATPFPGEYIHLMDHLDTTPVTSSMIANWTNRDRILAKVKHYILQGWPDSSPGKEFDQYYNRRSELTLHQGCIIWGARVVVPVPGRAKLLDELHLAHPGVVRMKALCRSYFWWPGVDSDIQSKVRSCYQCQQRGKLPTHAPLHPWEWPDKPWTRLHLDFAGPFENNMILIMVDAHSKYIDAHIMPSATTAATISAMQLTFSTHGLPHTIVTDNGTNFTSKEFEDYCVVNGIKHIKTAPYHPSSNGLAERAVQTIKFGLRKQEGKSLQFRLNQLLFRYRITPSSVTNVSPAEMLMNRRPWSRLDLVVPDISATVSKRQASMKSYYDQRSKPRGFIHGDLVYAQNFGSHGDKWIAGIVEDNTGPVSYRVRLVDGRLWRRHIDSLRPRYCADTAVNSDHNNGQSDIPLPTATPVVTPVLPTDNHAASVVPTESVGRETPEETRNAHTANEIPTQTQNQSDDNSGLRRSHRVRRAPDKLDL